MLKDKILNKEAGIFTYGIAPPKRRNTDERKREIAAKQKTRLSKIDMDGLILYDIDEEDSRTDKERPFPFLPTVDPVVYNKKFFSDFDVPKIIYRCVGKYSRQELTEWIKGTKEGRLSVFVGASSSDEEVKLQLNEAYSINKKVDSNIILGGVTIPERHAQKKNEHLRIINKTKRGCKFFVSQLVYNEETALDFLSDYYYYCRKNQIEMVPIIFSLTPCGSTKTLEFMKWLGISIPHWMENELKNSKNILDKSINLLERVFEDLSNFAVEKNIPIGFNVESVSIRKEEIEASIELFKDIKKTWNEKYQDKIKG